ncbi:hypothetical protein [Sphingobium sp. CR28]|uniref:hypothetical protein n=1 Tax=Sphingobium sp. CR28 TaxID=3400272 RepID=UPI003FEFA587
MTGWIRNSARARGVFIASVLLVLLLRTFVPTGFMPVETNGKIVVQLCTGYGPTSVVIDRRDPAPTDQHKAADHPCTFAGGFAGNLLAPFTPLPLAVPPLPTILLPFGAAIADLTIQRLAAPPPPAIGPPSTR